MTDSIESFWIIEMNSRDAMSESIAWIEAQPAKRPLSIATTMVSDDVRTVSRSDPSARSRNAKEVSRLPFGWYNVSSCSQGTSLEMFGFEGRIARTESMNRSLPQECRRNGMLTTELAFADGWISGYPSGALQYGKARPRFAVLSSVVGLIGSEPGRVLGLIRFRRTDQTRAVRVYCGSSGTRYRVLVHHPLASSV